MREECSEAESTKFSFLTIEAGLTMEEGSVQVIKKSSRPSIGCLRESHQFRAIQL